MAASAPISKTIYLGPFAHSRSLTELDICPDGAIGVNESGVICFIERGVELDQVRQQHVGWEDARLVKIDTDSFFFPGFVDTHTHASQHANTGLFGKTTLMDWLEHYTFPMESSFSNLNKAESIYSSFVARTLSHGTTTCAYYATIHVPATNLLADICLSRGQRALVGRVCMNSLPPDTKSPEYRDLTTEDSVRASQASIDYIRSIDPQGEIVQPIVTPRFAPSCTADCLSAMGALAARNNAHIQTHISENKKEIELVKEAFPNSKSYTDVYDTASLLTPRTILAHAIHLSHEERATILARGAKISHCPASNTAITSGCAPIRELLSEGHTIGLGTDVSGGFHPSILENVRHAIWVSRHLSMTSPLGDKAKLSTEEALYLATRGGAAVVGLEGKIGGFDVGLQWDAQAVSLDKAGEADGPVDVFGWETGAERVEKWVYSGDDRNTIAVWVRGRLVHAAKKWENKTSGV